MRRVDKLSPAAALRALAPALILLIAASAHAFSGGIATTSFPVPAQGCNFCHGGGSTPTVTLECVDCGAAPPSVEPLSVHEFKLTVVEIGLQDHAGLNVSSVLGTLSTGGAFSADTHTLTGSGGRQEITHSMPKAAAGGVTEFSFLWTAPASPRQCDTRGLGQRRQFQHQFQRRCGELHIARRCRRRRPGRPPTRRRRPIRRRPRRRRTVACPPSADPGCQSGFGGGLLSMKASVPGKEKLIAKLLHGPALAQTDLGNPLDAAQGGTGTAYALCVYAGTASLAGSVVVDRAGDVCAGKPCWKPIGKAPNDPSGPGKGYKYKDGSLAADGVLKLLYKGGDAGSSRRSADRQGSRAADRPARRTADGVTGHRPTAQQRCPVPVGQPRRHQQTGRDVLQGEVNARVRRRRTTASGSTPQRRASDGADSQGKRAEPHRLAPRHRFELLLHAMSALVQSTRHVADVDVRKRGGGDLAGAVRYVLRHVLGGARRAIRRRRQLCQYGLQDMGCAVCTPVR